MGGTGIVRLEHEFILFLKKLMGLSWLKVVKIIPQLFIFYLFASLYDFLMSNSKNVKPK